MPHIKPKDLYKALRIVCSESETKEMIKSMEKIDAWFEAYDKRKRKELNSQPDQPQNKLGQMTMEECYEDLP